MATEVLTDKLCMRGVRGTLFALLCNADLLLIALKLNRGWCNVDTHGMSTIAQIGNGIEAKRGCPTPQVTYPCTTLG